MEDTILVAKKRKLQGSSNARRMRREGVLPGVVYSEGKEAVAVQLDTHEFELLLHHHTSETLLVEIDLEGEGVLPVLVKDVQHHPVTSELVHVDLLKVAADKPIHVEIAIEVVGEAAGVKAGGLLELVQHAVAVECLPGDLVEAIEVDVSGLQIGESLTAAELPLGSKLRLLGDADAIVVAVTEPRVESEEEEGGAGAAEPEVISAKKAEEA